MLLFQGLSLIFMFFFRTYQGNRTAEVVRKEIQELEDLMKGTLPTLILCIRCLYLFFINIYIYINILIYIYMY